MAFMVMTMASSFESRAKSDFGIGPSANVASSEVITETIGAIALLGRYSTR